MHGIVTACAKHPISQGSIQSMVDAIEEELAAMGRAEVKSNVVGGLVLEHLKKLDPMAYIRFAIVYLDLDRTARAARAYQPHAPGALGTALCAWSWRLARV